MDAIMKLHRAAEPPRLRYFIERDPAAQAARLLPGIGVSDPRWG